MNIFKKLSSVFALAVLFIFAVTAAEAQTTAFTYQGRLNDGNTAASGAYDLQFALYDAETGGNQIGTPLARPSVNISNGIFTVTLNFGASPFAAGASRFLEIAVKKTTETNYTTLTPRQPLTASPYSIRTLSATTADALSSACVGCVSNNQINAIDGAKITGTITNATAANADRANTANEARTALTAGNVTGIVAIANGGTGSSTQNFVDTTTAQTIAGAKTFSDNLRITAPIRAGTETGVFETPYFPTAYWGNYNGLITRRITAGYPSAGRIVARTDVLRLERDGTLSGWRITYDASANGPNRTQTVHCIGINNTGALVPVRLQLEVSAPVTTQLYTDAQKIEYMQCTFGNAYFFGHQTQITLQAATGGYNWIGFLTSTFNQ